MDIRLQSPAVKPVSQNTVRFGGLKQWVSSIQEDSVNQAFPHASAEQKQEFLETTRKFFRNMILQVASGAVLGGVFGYLATKLPSTKTRTAPLVLLGVIMGHAAGIVLTLVKDCPKAIALQRNLLKTNAKN